MAIIFEGYNIVLRFLRADKSWRIEIDVSDDQKEALKKIMDLPDGIFEIEIRPKIITEDQ